jgi:hypothetical protein
MQLANAPESKISSKKRKRLDKYIASISSTDPPAHV